MSYSASARHFKCAPFLQTVVIGVSRYIAVCHPFLALRIGTMKYARIATLLVAALSIFIHLPYYALVSESLIQYITLEFIIAYHKIFYSLCMFFILPFGILLILSLAIMAKLWKQRTHTENQQDRMIKARQQENMAVTRVIIIIILVFFLTYILKPVYVTDTYIFKWSGNEATQLLVFFLPAFNSVVNFYVYFTMQKSFRREFFSLWRKP